MPFKQNQFLRLMWASLSATSFSSVLSRSWQFTSVPQADMTSDIFRDPKKDIMGCYRSPKDFEAYYGSVCQQLGVPPEADSKGIETLNLLRGSDQYEDVIDPRGELDPVRTMTDIVTPVTRVSDKEKIQITWPWQYAKSTVDVGGLLRHVVYASAKSEIERNLEFVKSFSDQIPDGPGELAFVMQFYAGRAVKVSFEMLNFILERTQGKKLTEEELRDEKTVTPYIKEFLETLSPGASKNFKILMKEQKISAVMLSSFHTSIAIKYKLKDGSYGVIGAEVGRPAYCYVDGKLVANPHAQMKDPAVFQSMNNYNFVRGQIPTSIEEFMKIVPIGTTPENFGKINTKVLFDDIEEKEKRPVFPNYNLYGGTSGKRDTYLSEGVPVSVRTFPIPHAGRLARVLYFLTGQRPWEALRFGGYFAHHAHPGQSRACSELAILGSDVAGVQSSEFLPVLRDLKQYDFSQDMRELVYQNPLFMELEKDPSEYKKSDVGMFSLSTARNFLAMSKNAYLTMQIYKKVWDTAEKNKEDEEAQTLADELRTETINFTSRYRQTWSNTAFIVINMYRTMGVDVLLDDENESQGMKEALRSGKSSSMVTIAMALVKERMADLGAEIRIASQRTATSDVDAYDLDYSGLVQSLEMAQKAYIVLQEIKKEIDAL